MLYWSLAGARRLFTEPHRHTGWDSADISPWLRRVRVTALAAARSIRITRFVKRHWQKAVFNLALCTTLSVAALVSIGFYHVYFDRSDLPGIEPFARFEFPTIGTVYDANGRSLI